jgi:serine protease Do
MVGRFALVSLVCASMVMSGYADDGKCMCSPQQTSKAFTAVAKKAIPGVVFIKVQGAVDQEEYVDGGPTPFDQFGDDFFRRFFGTPYKNQPKAPPIGQGSGFLVSADGYVMTNAHVIKGAEKITIVLNDGKEIDATVVGTDVQTDLAILKIEGKNYPFLKLGNSDAMDIGEWVVAIGSPFQLEASLTVGVVSAKGRQNLRITDLEDFIQTDAAINPGNSGGPLLNLDSEVIGINTAIVSRSGGYMGIGFAIPSNMAKNVMTQIIDKGSVSRGYMGVSLQPIDKGIAEAFGMDKAEGALVSEVVKDSPADKAGLKQGDVILELNGTTVKSVAGLRNDISLMEPGKKIVLKVNRKGQTLTIPITLGTASSAMVASSNVYQKLGIEVETLTPERSKQMGLSTFDEGVVITKVKPGSPSALAGLRPGFIILAINHKKVSTITEFNDSLADLEVKKRVLILVRHGNATRFYSFKVD